jgi:hypothetical protein
MAAQAGSNGRFEVVVYPRDLDAAELSFGRLGWEVVDRFGSGPGEYGVVYRIPCDEVVLELVQHDTARALVERTGTDVVAGLRLRVADADEAYRAVSTAGLRLDPVCESGPSDETWGRLVRTYTGGGLRIDFVQMPQGS